MVVEWGLEGRGCAPRDATIVAPRTAEALDRLEHELRTPLAAIRAIAEILRDDADLATEDRSILIEAILIEQARLARTLETLLGALGGR